MLHDIGLFALAGVCASAYLDSWGAFIVCIIIMVFAL